MNRLVLTIILGCLIVAAAVVGINSHNEQVAKLTLDLDKERLRTQFMERAAGLHGISQTDKRADELTAAFKWYKSEIASACNKAPGVCDAEGTAEAAPAPGGDDGKKGDSDLRKEFTTETKGLYDLVLKGAYHPFATAMVEGIRLDLLSLKRVQADGHSRLRLDVAIWNAPSQVDERGDVTKELTRKKVMNFSLKGLSFDCYDTEETKLGGAAGGGPNFTIGSPDRFVSDFPPGGALAVWYLDPLPEKSATMDFRLSGELKTPSNASVPVNQEWNLKVDPAWVVQAGEKFEGETREMPEEEMKRSAHK